MPPDPEPETDPDCDWGRLLDDRWLVAVQNVRKNQQLTKAYWAEMLIAEQPALQPFGGLLLFPHAQPQRPFGRKLFSFWPLPRELHVQLLHVSPPLLPFQLPLFQHELEWHVESHWRRKPKCEQTMRPQLRIHLRLRAD